MGLVWMEEIFKEIGNLISFKYKILKIKLSQSVKCL